MASGSAIVRAETKTEEWIRRFFRPKVLNTLRETSLKTDLEPLEIEYIREPGAESEIIALETIYPFHSILDIKTAIYLAKNRSPDFLPIYQALMIELDEGGRSFLQAEYDWMKPIKEGAERLLYLANPFSVDIPNPNPEFTTSSGQAKPLKLNIFTRMTFENRIVENYTAGLPRLKLYLFRDIYNSVRVGGAELSEMEWTRRIKPYFPQILRTKLEPNQEDIEFAQKMGKVFEFDGANLERIEAVLPSVETLDYKIKSVRNLRLLYAQPEEEESRDIPTSFYETEVNSVLPFLRMLPSQGSPITKVYLQGELRIPEIADPKLLLQWAQIRNPNPEYDFMFGKVVLNQSTTLPQKLYGTFQMFGDRTADISILPPKLMKKFDVDRDLYELGSSLGSFIEKTPYRTQTPNLGNTSVLCTFQQEIGRPAITKLFLKGRLAAFSQFFQQIPPLPGETAPIATLRYKAVSNFTSENKIYTFISQLYMRQQITEESALLELLMNEFRLTRFESKQYLDNWLLSEKDLEETAPDSNDFIPIYNRGTDISIYRASQNSYVVAVYGLQSVVDLHRIMTCLGMIFMMTDEQVEEIQPAPTAVAAAAQDEEDTEFLFMGEPEMEGEEKAAAAVVATSIQEEALRDEVSGGLEFLEGMEAFLEEEEDTANVSAAAAAAPSMGAAGVVQSIAEDSRDTAAEKHEVPGAAAARAAAVPAKPAPLTIEKGSLAKFFLKKLQDTDLGLFSFKRYTSDCQASDTRQPAVMNKEQFAHMQSVYLMGEPPVYFRVYPLKGTEQTFPPGSEVYTALRYGSNPAKSNFYVCCRYFCIRDYMVVTESDFVGEKDRFGRSKKKNTCPFCGGTKIENLKEVEEGQTVFERKLTPSKKRHTHIGFLKIIKHPEGYPLPCCFSEDEPIYYSSHPAYLKERELLAKTAAAMREEEEEVAAPAPITAGLAAVDYAITLSRFYRKYILGPEKFPLDVKDEKGPQIGLLQPGLDAYFQQDPKDIAMRSQIRMELKADAQGFLRLAAENRLRYREEAFFSALAPYLHRNSADGVRERIREVLTPKLFVALNYGNLCLEFYDPSDPAPTDDELQEWSLRELEISLNLERNKYQLLRIYKSFQRFRRFLYDRKALKEYRQFAQLLTEGILAGPESNGLVLIVIDLDTDGNVSVRCPPYGYNVDQYDTCDIAFISHHPNNIWEPLFYFKNTPPGRPDTGNLYQLEFQRGERDFWPEIVKKRTQEFMMKCAAPGRAPFTSQSGIQPLALLPLSQVYKGIGETNAYGIIRDAYNHVVGLTYRTKPSEKRSGRPVVVPVVDDGFIITEKKIHLGWDDFEPATGEDVIWFYNQLVLTTFPNYPGYKPLRRCLSEERGGFIAIQLANGVYVPIKLTTKVEGEMAKLEETSIEEFEWEKNMEIYFGKRNEKPEVQQKIKAFLEGTERDLLEIYAHLRVSFANWFSISASPELRKEVEKILSDTDIPLFERRKRLEILIGEEILSWMDDTPRDDKNIQTLLRVDCRVRTEGDCKGRCIWKPEGESCKLHTPETLESGERLLNVKRLFLFRLLDELLRFPEKSVELRTDSVSKLSDMTQPILLGRQYILPEKSLAWYDLLRLKWVQTLEESPEFFEEFSRPPPAGPLKRETRRVGDEGESKDIEINLPDFLIRYLGAEDPTLADLYLYSQYKPESPLTPYLTSIGIFLDDIGAPEGTGGLTQEQVVAVANRTNRVVIQLDFRPPASGDNAIALLEPQILVGIPAKAKGTENTLVLVLTSEGTAMFSTTSQSAQSVPVFKLPQKLQAILEQKRREVRHAVAQPRPANAAKGTRRKITIRREGGSRRLTRRQNR
jgi:hypothetical protein